MAAFNGYLALGSLDSTGTVFTELGVTVGGYARQPIALDPVGLGAVRNSAALQFPNSSGSAWPSFQAYALYDSAAAGIQLMAWGVRTIHTIRAGRAHSVAAGAIELKFPRVESNHGTEVIMAGPFTSSPDRLIAPASTRQPSQLGLWCDSRGAQYTTDVLQKNVSNANVISVANALSGKRFTMGVNPSVAGLRSDEMIAKLDALLASTAGTGITHLGVNDVAAAATGFVSTGGPMAGQTINLSNVAQHVVQNVQFGHRRMMDSGFRQNIVFLEPGATNLSAAQVGAIHEINQRQREAAEYLRGMILFDLPFYVWLATSSASTIAFKSGYRRYLSGTPDNDPTHLSSAGALAAGAGLAQIFSALVTPFPRELRSINEVASANSQINQLVNPMFTTTSGGTAGAGASGTVPGSWTAQRESGGSGTQSVAVSVGDPADGAPGKETIMACTFAAAGDAVSLRQDWTLANWSPGDIIQGGCEVSIDDCAGLAGAYYYLQANGSGGGLGAVTAIDMLNVDNTAMGSGALKYQMLTEKLVIPAYTTKSWVTSHLKIVGAAAGSVTVRIRRMQGKRRFS